MFSLSSLFRKRTMGAATGNPPVAASGGSATEGSHTARAKDGPPSAAATAPGPDRIALAGKRVTVFGLGASGRAATRLLLREGATVTVTDDARGDAALAAARDLPEGVRKCIGQPAEALQNAELIVLSPGVPRTHPAVRAALDAGVPLIGEIELASWFLTAPLIGITGTNGKSTVTSLIGHILSGWKPHVFTGGNLGDPLATAALSDAPWDFLVVELSSFQLESIRTLRPRVAVLLNLAPDHLDRYASVADYYRAKFHIFDYMRDGYALLNHADPGTPLVTEHYLKGASPVLFNVQPEADTPVLDGVRVQDGVITVRSGGRDTPVCPVADLKILGAHNVENAQAAAAACLLAGCPIPLIARGLASFTALAHRMEVVPSQDGITWINDSKATNPASVIKALDGQKGPLILLLGGRDKGSDLFSLREHVFLHTYRVILFGEAAEKFRIVMQGYPNLDVTETLHDAVKLARATAAPGDTVLMSPACASFDEFRNYVHRGDSFRAWVQEGT